MVVEGFCGGGQNKGSDKIFKLFEQCILQNYNESLEEFILCLHNFNKRKARVSKKLNEALHSNMMKYIKHDDTDPVIALLYLQSASQNIQDDVTIEEGEELKKYFNHKQSTMSMFDRASVLKSFSQLTNVSIEGLDLKIDIET
jgi:hypothetical protein